MEDVMKLDKLLPYASLALYLCVQSSQAQQEHQHHAAAGKPERLGTVSFQISCLAAPQSDFNRAVALLHTFWYDEARKAFTELSSKDPTCGMAYWGIAMTLYHPLWAPPSSSELKEGWAAVQKAKAVGAKTQRELDYIGAIGTFYMDFENVTHRMRALAYEKAMENLYLRYPDDGEAAIFYALALNGTALPEDKTYANQKKAGEILEKIFTAESDHPGVAHYIIHSYDYPPLANRGLDAARRYAKIAPSSPHVLHMPSHIFTRLGLWQESIESNIASAAAARDHVQKTRPGAASFDELHAMDYLVYAYLQGGQDGEAKRIVEKIRNMEAFDEENFAAAYALAAMPVRYALERRSWSEAAVLTLQPQKFSWERLPYAEALVHFGRALGAARSGRPADARPTIERIHSIKSSLSNAKQNYWADQVEILRLAASAWTTYAEGKKDEALKLMQAAADLESNTEKHPVTPGAVLPARELLGDMFMELKEPERALREYETSLKTSPGRFNGLYGAAQAARISGAEKLAQKYFADLVANCSRADTNRPELSEAKAFLGPYLKTKE